MGLDVTVEVPPANLPDNYFVEYVMRFRPELMLELQRGLVDRLRANPVDVFRVWLTVNGFGPVLVAEIAGVLAGLGDDGEQVARSLHAQGFDVSRHVYGGTREWDGVDRDEPATCALAEFVRARVPAASRRELWGGGFRSGKFVIGWGRFGIPELHNNVRYPLPKGAAEFVQAPPRVRSLWKVG